MDEEEEKKGREAREKLGIDQPAQAAPVSGRRYQVRW